MEDKTYTFRIPAWGSLSPFLLAILGFFMVFTEIDCNGQTMITMTGYDLVTGIEKDPETGAKEQADPNLWAIFSLAAAVGGIVVYTTLKGRKKWMGLAISALIGLSAMVVLFFNIQRSVSKELTSEGDGTKLDMDMVIDVHMRFGYWFVAICFGIALVWNLYLGRKSLPDSQPPPPFSTE